MAVKEYSSEAASNHRTENLNYSINIILAYIDEIRQNIDETDLAEVFRKIVNMLGHVEIPKQADHIKVFRDNIKKVDQFLEMLSERYNSDDIVNICLKELLVTIMVLENPSPAAGIVLHRIPETKQWFTLRPDCEDDILRGVNVLMKWITASHFITNLKQWIIVILKGLCNQKKFGLLMDIAEKNIDHLLNLAQMPTYKEFVWPIILHMMASIQHSPVVFDRVLKLYAKSNREQLTKDPQLADQLDNTIAALLVHFPHRPEHDALRHKLQPSTNFQDSLDVPPWHDHSKIIKRDSNVRIGLMNLGNTCYMNSVLQALMLSKQFTRELLMTDVRTPLFQQMQRLMALLLHSDRTVLTPNAVLQAARPPGFHPGHEQDSSEFLGHLLDQLHEQEKSKLLMLQHQQHQQPLCSMSMDIDIDLEPPQGATIEDITDDEPDSVARTNADAANSNVDPLALNAAEAGDGGGSDHPDPDAITVIQRSFGGAISITYKCLECQTESKQFDAFRDLHLSFPDPDSNSTHSVQELLDFYCNAERLDADNKYYCDQCKRLCVGERYIDIVSAPRCLILTLKHFKYDQKFNMRAKLMHKVHHEEIISVHQRGPAYQDGITLHYRLYAAVVHAGISMETGHYFTYGTDAAGLCYRFDDRFVCRTSKSELYNLQPPQTPYILFYQRIDDPKLMLQQQQQQQNQFMQQSPRKSPMLLPSTSVTEGSGGRPMLVAGGGPVGESASFSRNPNVHPAGVNGSDYAASCSDYPALEDLPPQLREHVNHDNIQFGVERNGRRERSDDENSSVMARNRRNDTFRPDDDDDDSNGGSYGQCGTNFSPTINRYIS